MMNVLSSAKTVCSKTQNKSDVFIIKHYLFIHLFTPGWVKTWSLSV